MNNDYKKIQILLDNVIKVLEALINKNLFLDEERERILLCLKEIKKKYFLSDYLNNGPQGYEITMIDEMILSLDYMLLDAGKKKQQNTMLYILKTVIYAIGVGHRILTAEEQKEASVVTLKRRMRVEKYMEAIRTAEKMDEAIQLRQDLTVRQEELKKRCHVCEKKIKYIDTQRPDVLEEIRYYFDVEDMSAEAIEYLDMKTLLEREKKNVFDNQKRIAGLADIIYGYQQELAELKNDNSEEFVTDKVEKELENTLVLEDDVIENGKIENAVVDLESIDMINLMYDAMAELMNSSVVDEYIERSMQEYEELELSGDLI